MAVTIKKTKYLYPPRPGNGSGTFSDNIVGLQTVDGGGLTQGNFEFTTNVVDKVNRTFNIGAFSTPISLDNLQVENLSQSLRIQAQYGVNPNYDLTNVLNFSLYGSLAKRLSVSITKIINFFPASLDILATTPNFLTGDTATNISYDSVNDETYFEVDVQRINNPFGIDFTISGITFPSTNENISIYRNLNNTYLDYAVVIDNIDYKVTSFSPSLSNITGTIAFYVSGSPFGITATTYNRDFVIRPNDFIVDKVFAENFDPVEDFLLNRLTQPIYTATFQIPAQNTYGQFYPEYRPVTWPLDGLWNLDIRSRLFDDYLTSLQDIAEVLDSFKTNILSRFLTSGSLKEFDTLGRKVEKVFQIYGRSFDQLKTYVDALSFMNNVNYNPSNDIPNELLVDLSQTLGWGSNFSPITNDNFLDSIFGNQITPNYPGYARALTANELNYAFYRNLILNSSYIFKSKGTRRSIEFLLNLIGAPESIIEYNEHVYLADQKIDMTNFFKQYGNISGGTYVDEKPSYDPNNVFKLRGIPYTGFTTLNTYTSVGTTLSDYPVDNFGFPSAPTPTDSVFFQKGAGWYEQTPQHRSPEQLTINGNLYKGQNLNIQTQLQPFSYGQQYLDVFRKFPFINDGFKLQKIIDNNKSWLYTDDRLRISNQANYNAYYYVDDERLVLNVKNVDLFLNPAQGLVYDIWTQSKKTDYPIPETGLTEYYPVPGGLDVTFINPEPKKKTFFEFSQTFWNNMINVRNRQFITDGKTGGYPTLQSLWWKYIQQEENIGVQNNQYTYQKLIDYSLGLGPNWMKLLEQMIPATTIWNTGIRYENSVLHKQKFLYRRQRGCQVITKPIQPCLIVSNLTQYNQTNEFVKLNVFPWLNGNTNVSNFSGILYNTLNNVLASNGYTIATCSGAQSVTSQWYVVLTIGSQTIINELFTTKYGINSVPTNQEWLIALTNALPQIIPYNLTYNISGNQLTITNLGTQTLFLNQNLNLSVGININVTC